ncbi:MAG: NAD(P)H-dependent oxidoreductase [Bacteroidales bacterium]|jgi:flavodoxin|nr:NAD(P)H-dependent oxidoreductase [Bacteroidales bacterium]
MKTLVISYSYTGNNEKLAKKIAQQLKAELTILKDMKKRTVFTILFDVLFNRIPRMEKTEKQINDYEHLVFVAPVWFGKIASPLRTSFKQIKGMPKNCSLVTLSAGADGKNQNLENEFIKRTGLKPGAVINPLISELFPDGQKPDRKELDAYRLSEKDAATIVKKIINELNQKQDILN